MSDHAWILESLAAYLTGGLEPAERERLEQHIADCASCADALNDARALDLSLSGLFVEARPSAALEDRVIQTLRTRPLVAWRLGWLAIAAAALVLIGLTGALASQVVVSGQSAPPGMTRFSSIFLSDMDASGEADQRGNEVAQRADGKDVTKLAAESRETMLLHLDDQNEVKRERGPQSGGKAGLMGRSYKTPPAPRGPGSAGAFFGVELKDEVTKESKPHDSMPQRRVEKKTADIIVGQKFVTRDSNSIMPLNSFQPGKMLDQSKDKEITKRSNSDFLQFRDTENLGERDQITDEKQNRKLGEKLKLAKNDDAKKLLGDKQAQQPGPRKIVIRTGEIEYEVQSFDAAVATITRLVKNIKNGFIATVNSDKLANGKVRGSVVVRVPPENLDELILDLRTNLGKSGELKNQRIGSQDITKQYTDLESELKAARAMEERLLEIIKTGKGQIKDLLAAEKELGTWRTRIEKTEGELRYYANQVALSTLTIALYEKEITAPFAVIEREQVQMGIEVEDVDQALQAAQKAVREAKGRITRAELKQPSQGQFSAVLHFEVAPDAAGPLRDRLKQLGTVARFNLSRLEETQGGGGKPSDARVKRSDTRFYVHFYNLTDVLPRETVLVNLACVNVETAMKTLLARVEKAAGRVVSSNLASTRGTQNQGDLQFQVKTPLADAVLEDIKSAGEVMALQVREITNVETTRKKRGFQVKLLAWEAATARETDEVQLACADVAASYRIVQEAVLKAKGRIFIAQLNEQDRRQITATLDFEVRRADEDGVRAALLKAGAIYTRKVNRAADAENVVDTKVRRQVTFLNQTNIPPRETYLLGVEVADVDQTAAMLSALAGKREGRTVEANISRERNGQITGRLVYDVPMTEIHELFDALKSSGTVRVQKSIKHPEIPDSSLAVARLDVTLSNTELMVPSDSGFGPNVRRGFSDSFTVLFWSLRILILGLCVILPWALVIWAIYRLVIRLRRRTTPASPAA